MAGEHPRQETGEAVTARPAGALDREGALARLGGDIDLLRAVAQTFRLEGPRLLGLIREGVAAGDGKAMRRAAHTLRGSAGVFAAKGIEDLAGRLEEIGETGRMDEAPAVVAALASQMEEFLASLAELSPAQG